MRLWPFNYTLQQYTFLFAHKIHVQYSAQNDITKLLVKFSTGHHEERGTAPDLAAQSR